MLNRMPLVLIPGLLCDGALWQHQTKHLEGKAEFHIADTTQNDRIEALAAGVLAGAPRQFAMGALSMGGYVALEIMRRAPERVLKLSLLDTSARADTDEQRERRRLLLVMAKTGHFKGVTPRLLPMLIHPDRIEDKDLTHIIISMAERMGRNAFANQQTAIMNRIDSRPHLKAIKCPTQIIVGAQDALTPPDIAKEIADGVAGSRLDIIEDCGHLAPLEKPDQVNRLMQQWLSA